MKQITIFFAFLLMTATVIAQSEVASDKRSSPQQTLFFGLGGQGLGLSLNYDTRFTKSLKGIGGRIGVGYIIRVESHTLFGIELTSSTSSISIPITVNYLIGSKGHYFEVGAGTTFGNTRDIGEADIFRPMGTMVLGFRIQPEDGGFNFRVALVPLFGKEYLFPSYEFSFGHTFKVRKNRKAR